MPKYTFENDFYSLGRVGNVFDGLTVEDFADETMFFSSSLSFVMKNADNITQKIIDCLPLGAFEPADNRHIVIDTRVHMLMPGMIPAIPGWHCDAMPRRNCGQPDIFDEDGKHNVNHWIMVVGTDPHSAMTQFVDEPFTAYIDPDNVWKSVSEQVEALNVRTMSVKSGEIIQFNTDCLHRAVPATSRCWRLFFRLSHYQNPPQNKIRKQTQVYTTEHSGW